MGRKFTEWWATDSRWIFCKKLIQPIARNSIDRVGTAGDIGQVDAEIIMIGHKLYVSS